MAFKMKAGPEGPFRKNFPSAFKDNGKLTKVYRDLPKKEKERELGKTVDEKVIEGVVGKQESPPSDTTGSSQEKVLNKSVDEELKIEGGTTSKGAPRPRVEEGQPRSEVVSRKKQDTTNTNTKGTGDFEGHTWKQTGGFGEGENSGKQEWEWVKD